MGTTKQAQGSNGYHPDRYEERERQMQERLDLARSALVGSQPGISQLADRIAEDVYATLYRKTMATLMPAVRETADRVVTEAMQKLTQH